ncbi:MAG: sulfotransferase [Acidobacteria bacterium]|nr:MAG: sulfotransferase [Acidobacteriota bacterium]REK08750.1 MAG: sulfotransferase [Acidobacteriota bacterium]
MSDGSTTALASPTGPPAPRVRQRLFVVGAPRSGTTLLQSLLAAHPDVASFTESHLFSRHYRPWPRLGAATLLRDPRPRLAAWRRENALDDDGDGGDGDAAVDAELDRLLAAALLRPLRGAAVGRCLLRAIDLAAQRRGRAVWVEKTPRHLLYLDWLERLAAPERRSTAVAEDSPRLDFVHVVRRGEDVVRSLHAASRSWPRPYPPAECVRRWNHDVALTLRRVGTGPGRDHLVVYEHLVASPEAVLRSLLVRLGLAWTAAVLDDYAAVAEGLVTAEETWKQDVARPIAPTGGRREEPVEGWARRVRAELYRGAEEIAASQSSTSPSPPSPGSSGAAPPRGEGAGA